MDLDNLKENDEVIVRDNFGSRIKMVNRVTKTTVVIDGTTFSKKTGRNHGSSVWNRKWLELVTEETRGEAEEEQRRRVMQSRIGVARNQLRDAKITSGNIELVEAFIKEMGLCHKAQQQG